MEESAAVVIDNGTGLIKAGIAGEDAPRAYFPSCVGVPLHKTIHGNESNDIFVGKDAHEKKGVLTLKYPISNGIVTDKEDMTKIWHHTYSSELNKDPSDQPVLLTEAPRNPKKNREDMIEIFFETFEVPAFYVFTQAVLALYASGRTTGVVMDSGDGVTHVVVVFDGYNIEHAVSRVDIAGRNLTTYLMNGLAEDGKNFAGTAEKEIAREMKEKICYIPLDFDEEMKKFMESSEKKTKFELPDGNVMEIGSLTIRTPECLFQPKMLGLDIHGIHQSVHDTIKMCDINIQRELYESIVLSGGTTMFEGFQERLNKEISALVPTSVNVKITAPMERKFSIWIGGSVLASLATFQTTWITKEEYQDVGPSIVHTKC